MQQTLTEAPVEYGASFFEKVADGSRRSAEEVAELVVSLFAPDSIVDVGGGTGLWAAAFLERGVRKVLAVDGPWVPKDARAVSPEHFHEHDLSTPLRLDTAFDLAMSLEAAEHVPENAAPDLVQSLTDLAPIVLFSAALPGQGGDGHINERLPSYWVELFAGRGYDCYTDLRTRIWFNEAVEVWYRQNLLCFVKRTEVAKWGHILKERREAGDPLLDIAHPGLVLRHKRQSEGLEGYAHRLEAQVAQSTEATEEAKHALARLQTKYDLVVNSRAWRTWQAIRRLLPRRSAPRSVQDGN